MRFKQYLRPQLHVSRHFLVELVSFMVVCNGLFIVASLLLAQIDEHRAVHLSRFIIDLPLLIGLGLIYLGALLKRRKRTAWLVTIAVYITYFVLGIVQVSNHHLYGLHQLVRAFILPLLVLSCLLYFRSEYVVKSDIRGFGFAARFSVLILFVAFIYGTVGFLLMDDSDFHREIGLTTAAHYTIDQFNLTTSRPLHPYTRRAHLFDDSLSDISLAAVAYVVLSLFQPLRFKLADHSQDRERLKDLLQKYGSHSEEFFKLWPHDKQFFFDSSGQSGLSFHVSRGVALCLSGPVGNKKYYPQLLSEFNNLCFGNDWLPALIHVEDDYRLLYEQNNFGLQKLGQEAVVDIAKFNNEIAGKKYFRQIRNKFNKNGYSHELLAPPHHQAIVDRLQTISDEWLSQGARAERGFVMGYFTPEYIQQCELLVARDAANTIQAFINIVPADFDRHEATYDMLRHASNGLGNVNDFILMGLIDHLRHRGYQRLNLGLCPLVGLDVGTDKERNKLIDSFLGFAYANGDRFYSFQGLQRFKAKYEPEWRDRYVAYQGGLRGFARTMNALMRAMKI